MNLLKMVLSITLIFGLTLLVVGCFEDGATSGTTLASATITSTGSFTTSSVSPSTPTQTVTTPTSPATPSTGALVAIAEQIKQDFPPSTVLGNMGYGDPQELANDANAAIYSSFARNGNGSIMYPGDFGGAYFSDGKLIVCVTQEQRREHYKSLLNASQNSIVIYKVVKHSFNDLMQLAKDLAVKEDAFITYGVDVMNNRAEVFLPNEAKVKSNNLENNNSDIPVVYKFMPYIK